MNERKRLCVEYGVSIAHLFFFFFCFSFYFSCVHFHLHEVMLVVSRSTMSEQEKERERVYAVSAWCAVLFYSVAWNINFCVPDSHPGREKGKEAPTEAAAARKKKKLLGARKMRKKEKWKEENQRKLKSEMNATRRWSNAPFVVFAKHPRQRKKKKKKNTTINMNIYLAKKERKEKKEERNFLGRLMSVRVIERVAETVSYATCACFFSSSFFFVPFIHLPSSPWLLWQINFVFGARKIKSIRRTRCFERK